MLVFYICLVVLGGQNILSERLGGYDHVAPPPPDPSLDRKHPICFGHSFIHVYCTPAFCNNLQHTTNFWLN